MRAGSTIPGNIRLLFAVMLCLSLFPPGPANCLRLPAFQTAHLTVVHEPGIGGAARRLVKLYQSVKEELETFFKTQFVARPTIVILRAERFRAVSGTDPMLIAYALPQTGTIVINLSALQRSEADLKTTLKHELCHLFLHALAGGGHLPRWLDEGICQVVSGTLGDIMISLKGDPISEALRRGKLLKLKSISKWFPSDRKSTLLAYAQSKAFVTFLINKYGKERLLEAVALLRTNQVENAFALAYGSRLDELEASWHNTLRSKVSFLTTLSVYIYELLFVLGAILVALGFLRQRIRKKHAFQSEQHGSGFKTTRDFK